MKAVNSVFTLLALFGCHKGSISMVRPLIVIQQFREIICSWGHLLLFNRLYSWNLQAKTSSPTFTKYINVPFQLVSFVEVSEYKFCINFLYSVSHTWHRLRTPIFRWRWATILSRIHSFSVLTLLNSCHRQMCKTVQPAVFYTRVTAVVYEELKYLICTIFNLYFLLEVLGFSYKISWTLKKATKRT